MVYGASAPRHPRRQILTAQIQPDARQVISRMEQAVAPLGDHGPQFPMGKFEPSKDWTAPTYASPRSRPEELLLVSGFGPSTAREGPSRTEGVRTRQRRRRARGRSRV